MSVVPKRRTRLDGATCHGDGKAAGVVVVVSCSVTVKIARRFAPVLKTLLRSSYLARTIDSNESSESGNGWFFVVS